MINIYKKFGNITYIHQEEDNDYCWKRLKINCWLFTIRLEKNTETYYSDDAFTIKDGKEPTFLLSVSFLNKREYNLFFNIRFKLLSFQINKLWMNESVPESTPIYFKILIDLLEDKS